MTFVCAITTVAALAYGSGPHRVGDLYLPNQMTEETPVVLSIHGGGLSAMRRRDASGIAEFLALNGCAVYNIDYCQASRETPWPACGDDCRAAARFLLNAGLKKFGLVPKRIWTIGVSAGGHLSLWTGLGLPAEQVAGIVSISGIADLQPDLLANPDRYRALFGGHDPSQTELDSADVMHYVRKGGPRILLTHAREDALVPEASVRNFYMAYRQVGEISFSQYSCRDEPNTGGHCIWRTDASNPQRLIPRIENEILRFMGLPGVDVYDYAGDDFARMFATDGWQTAILTHGQNFGSLSFLERHRASDEMFVLLSGSATLYQGCESVSTPMEVGKVYNVRRNTWHGISVAPKGKVLVVENTGDVCTERRVQRLVEIPGFAKVRVMAEGASPMISVHMDKDGTMYADVEGSGVAQAICELVDFVPTAAYLGCGWYVAEPGDFSLAANGHENATRYAGFDLVGGRSVVVASSFVPLELYHRTAENTAGFLCAGPSRFAIFSGHDGVFNCALRSRQFFDSLGEVASPGVRSKAGKFCVDSWNGSFLEHADLIRRAASYGVTNDIFMLMHCWQRHGFDRHLPDVWPPNSMFGTADEAKETLSVAFNHGWQYGVHLNTIDVYSNSTWFAWDRVCYDAKGNPIRAWRNPYSHEQSFRLLHDFASKSAAYQTEQMGSDGFYPSTLFVDVSGGALQLLEPCRDRAGNPRTMGGNLSANGRMFDCLREWMFRTCGRMAFVSTESPCDGLVGHLDGGDCQWMNLCHANERVYSGPVVGGTGVITRIPWFSIVNHDRMVLHGAGYSARFENGRGELCHGVDSDDYISCEIMAGNSPMADCYNRDARDAEALIFRPMDIGRCLRQVIRKYWLLQPVARELSMARMTEARFADGNPMRVIVEWSTGMTVKVNRSEEDWIVDGCVLPQFGYRAWNPATGTESKVYRHSSGRVVEESSWHEGRRMVRYASARGISVPKFTPVEPVSEVSRIGASLQVKTRWRLWFGEDAPEGHWQVTYWLADPKFKESNPQSLMRKMKTVVVPLTVPTETSFDFPADIRERVSLLVSVAPVDADVDDPSMRLHMLGTAAFYRRFTQGVVEADGSCSGYACPDRTLWERLAPPKSPIDFGWVKTGDGVCVEFVSGRVFREIGLPLPESTIGQTRVMGK